ncbi:MAG: hypothetical protein IPM80_02510 [Proteobacteria bacterium]|nr:hypothetical protein [Pseudomonadota bacterium]
MTTASQGFTVMLARVTDKHGFGVMAVTVLIVVMSAIGVSKLEVENSFINYFRKHTEIYQEAGASMKP